MSYKAFYEHLAAAATESPYQHLAPARRLQETTAICLRSPSRRILDVGCGDGVLLSALGDTPASSGAQLIGVDLAESSLGRAPEQGRVRVSCADAAQLPFGAETFDLTVCAEVLEHLPTPEAALSEIHRVTRVGGRLVLVVPVVGWSRWLEAKLTGRVRFLSEPEHLREYSAVKLERCVLIRQLVNELARLGWCPAHRHGVYYYPHRGERLWNALLGHSPLARPAGWLDHELGNVPSLAEWGRYLLLECIKR